MPAQATGQQTCPHTGDWIKVDGLHDPSYNYTAPENKLVTEFCYKAGTSVVFHNEVPPSANVIVRSEIPAGHLGFLCLLFPGEHWCKDLSHASFRLIDDIQIVPTPTPTNEPTLEPTSTNTPPIDPTSTEPPENTPTPTEEIELTPTEVNLPSPTPTERPCPFEEIGELFLLTGPEGQKAWLASYQLNPNTGRWALPNTGSQQRCLGWIAVNAESGQIIYRDCNGNINILTRRCEGGGPCYAYINE